MVDIRYVREKLGLKQGEVAKAVGIAQATYCNIENGKGAPSVDSAKKIGRVLGINWWLVFEDEVELTPDEERFIEDFRMASAEEQAAIRRRLIRSANGGACDTRRSDDNRFDTAGEAALRNLPQR